MALLLYKSDEMFSSTELIRKSKMIFDKVLDEEIEKAIILRDGKPSFLLMEFSKYEKIMAEYEELKEYVAEIEGSTVPKKKSKKKKVKSEEDKKLKNELVEKSKKIAIPKMDYVEDIKKAKEKSSNSEVNSQDNVENKKETQVELQEDLSKEQTEVVKTQEVTSPSESLDDVKKQEMKEKILQARREREKIKIEDPEETKVQEQLEEQIAEDKLKKEQELEEFWD